MKIRINYLFLLIILAIAISYSISFQSKAFAHTKESVLVNGSVFETVGDIGEKKASEKGLTTQFKQKVKINGQTILFTESLYDGSSIHLAYLVKSDNKNDARFHIDFWESIIFTRDGKRSMLDGMSAGGRPLKNGVYAGTANIELRKNVPDSFMLGITSLKDQTLLAEVPIKLKGKSKSFPVNETKKWKGINFTYDKVTFFPTSTGISFQYLIDEKFIKDKDLAIHVSDDQGRILQPLSGGRSGVPSKKGKVLVTSNYYFEPLDTIPKSLTVKPYLLEMGSYKPETVRKKWKGKGFTLSQGDIGTLTVINVEKEGDLLTITYQIEGDRDYSQATAIWVEDANGKVYHTNHLPKRLEGNKYQMTFPSVNHLDDIYIATSNLRPMNYIEELEITMELKS